MRLLTISKLLLLGAGVAYVAKRVRAKRPASPFVDLDAGDPGPDPGDPVQGIDEAADLYVSDLSVDVVADPEDIFDADVVEAVDTGELYGVHTGHAVDRVLPDGDDSFEQGQNWIEALETSAVEYGAEPEQEVVPVDEVDEPPHPSDMRDTPVADRGSGGPGGT